MSDVRIVEIAARQFNRFSLAQVRACGMSDRAIEHRLRAGRWVRAHEGVFAIAPAGDDDRGAWMAATLTVPGTFLCKLSALAAWGGWGRHRPVETVVREGSGGPVRSDGLLVHRSLCLAGETATLDGIPLTTAARTLLDTAPSLSDRALARAVRETVRLEATSVPAIIDALARHRGRRGSRRLRRVVQRYSGLPLERARSGAEVRALEVLREGRRPMPLLNEEVADEEADLVWPSLRLIIEIDGGPWHLDVGEDARKEKAWRRAGWEVRRIGADDVYENPAHLLALAPNVVEPTP